MVLIIISILIDALFFNHDLVRGPEALACLQALLAILILQFAGKALVIATAQPGLQADKRGIFLYRGPDAYVLRVRADEGDALGTVRLLKAYLLYLALIENHGVGVKGMLTNCVYMICQRQRRRTLRIRGSGGQINTGAG